MEDSLKNLLSNLVPEHADAAALAEFGVLVVEVLRRHQSVHLGKSFELSNLYNVYKYCILHMKFMFQDE